MKCFLLLASHDIVHYDVIFYYKRKCQMFITLSLTFAHVIIGLGNCLPQYDYDPKGQRLIKPVELSALSRKCVIDQGIKVEPNIQIYKTNVKINFMKRTS